MSNKKLNSKMLRDLIMEVIKEATDDQARAVAQDIKDSGGSRTDAIKAMRSIDDSGDPKMADALRIAKEIFPADEPEEIVADEPEEIVADKPEKIVVDEPDEPPTPPQSPIPITTAMSNLSKSLPPNVFNNLKKAVSRVVKYSGLIKLRENKAILEPGDFEEFFDNFDDHQNLIKPNQEDNVVQDIRTAVIDAYGQVPNNKQAKQDLAAVLKYSQEIENIRATQGVTSGYSMNTSTGQSRGKQSPQHLNPEIAKAFSVAFKGNTLQARVKELQKFVDGLKAGAPVGKNISEKYSQFIIVELLMKIYTTQEPSSAGTIFESFCAFMAFGGEAVGTEGGMEDFKWTDQSGTQHLGSVKMVKKDTTTSQNIGAMTTKKKPKSNVDTTRMTYVVGYKTTNGQGTKAGEIPDRIDFYLYDIYGRSGNTVQLGPVGATSSGVELRMIDNKIDMKSDDVKRYSKDTATLDLSGISVGNFDDHSKAMVDSINSDLSSMLDGFSNLKSNIDNYLLAIDNVGERRVYSDQAILEYSKLQSLMTKSNITGLKENKKVNLKKLLESAFMLREAYSTLPFTDTEGNKFPSLVTPKQAKALAAAGIQDNGDLARQANAMSFVRGITKYNNNVAAAIFRIIFTQKIKQSTTEADVMENTYKKNWLTFIEGSSGQQAKATGVGFQPMAKRYLASRTVYKGNSNLSQDYLIALEEALGADFYTMYAKGKAIKNNTDIKKLAKQLISQLENPKVILNVTKRDPEVLTKADMRGTDPAVDSGYEIGSRSGSEKKVDFQVLRAFENMFGTKGTFEQKVAKLSKYIDEINQLLRNNNPIKEPIDNKFSGFIILDILNQLLYDQDATVAGWIFESFLAFMVGGTAIGSGYGAGDFIFPGPPPVEGSAKFLSNIVSSQNFDELKPNTKLRYVFGVKSSVQGNEIKKTTKEDKTGFLELYLADAIKKNGVITFKDAYTMNTNTSELDEKGRAQINVGGFEPKILDLTFMQELDFEDVTGKILNDINKNVKACLVNLDTSRNALNSYVLDKSQTSKLNNSVKSFNDIKSSLIPDPSKQIFGFPINESKDEVVITANFIKKLIKETLKK